LTPTELGLLGHGRLGRVDERGGVTLADGSSLVWWVGAEDRWRVPAAETAVRQRLVDDVPVVETKLRLPGGDVVARAYGAADADGTPGVVVELVNDTPVPVAMAVTSPRPRVRFAREPSQWVDDTAFFPLPHGATMRLAVGDPPPAPDRLPAAEQVARGWRLQLDAAARISVPDPPLASTVTAARSALLLADPEDPLAIALRAEALAAWGHEADARALADDLLRGTRRLADGTGSLAATGQALYALGSVARLAPDPEQLEAMARPVARAAHWIERKRMVRKHRKDARRARLLPAGPQPPELGAADQTYWDDWWSIAGLARAADLLAAAGQAEGGIDARRFAKGLADDVDRSAATVTAGLPSLALPAGPGRSLDAGIVGAVAGVAIGGADPDDLHVAATLDVVRAELAPEAGVAPGVLGTGASAWLTALLARAEAASGDRRAWTRLRWLVTAAAGRGGWPELEGGEPVVDVPLRDPDPVATAAFLLAVRTLLVAERGPYLEPPRGLSLLPVLPPGWVGQEVEVHDLPTAFGPLGFAVRWHGERPALLWELRSALGAPPFTLDVPGLDPTWSSPEPVGEALLAPVQEGTPW
jgi:hypothetical protein